MRLSFFGTYGELIHTQFVEPSAGPQKLCPHCGQPVFATDKVCGFCGHVLGVEVDTSSWNEPRVYRFSMLLLIVCWAMFGGLAVAMVYAMFAGANQNSPGGRWLFGGMGLIFVVLVAAATYSWRVKRVTLFADRVEWVGGWDGAHSCSYSELVVVEKPGYKSGPVYQIGQDGGPHFEVNSDLNRYQELADELRLRSTIARERAKGSA